MRLRLPVFGVTALALILGWSAHDVIAKPKHVAGHHRDVTVAHKTPVARAPKRRSVRLAKAAREVVVRHRLPVRTARQLPAGRDNDRVKQASLPLVLIDAGHGGRDGGAVGATGLLEKDVALATALMLERELRAQGRFRVELTRTADVSLSLSNRVARARARQPALLISIHADASPDPKARGASVYVRTAPDRGETITLPASSAAAGAIGRALSTGSPNPPPGSSFLQIAMVEQLKDDVAMVHDPARAAHLYVLGTVGVPSVLVEMGFVSNRHEERLLRTSHYRRTVAHAIRDAIGDYFDRVTYTMASGS